jgi:hypothetical protein
MVDLGRPLSVLGVATGEGEGEALLKGLLRHLGPLWPGAAISEWWFGDVNRGCDGLLAHFHKRRKEDSDVPSTGEELGIYVQGGGADVVSGDLRGSRKGGWWRFSLFTSVVQGGH